MSNASAPHRSTIDVNNLILAVGSLAMFASGAAFLYVVNPATSRLIPPCPFLAATNCYCPGCGAGRALHSLLRGDLLAALSFNPLLMLSLPLLGYFYLSFLTENLTGRRLPMPYRYRAYAWLVPAVIVTYWVARNLPWMPFTYLAP
jgi:hypothetical protein